MLQPYRDSAIVVRLPPRSKWRTRTLKALIWWKGCWKDRWARCAVCGKGLLPGKTMEPAGGGPGSRATDMLLDEALKFPCGHSRREHKEAAYEKKPWPKNPILNPR